MRRAIQARVPRLILISAVVALTFSTLLLRTWRLNQLPPGLWADEAVEGLDARDLLHGHFQVFFPRNYGEEPLYIYLATPFVAAWDGQAWAERLPAALLGTLVVPLLCLAGRALWRGRPWLGTWAGLASAGFWAANFWPQDINRLGLRVNALPLILLLAVVAWLSWTARPGPRRAAVFGLVAGLSISTYLAARITPLLWPALFLGLKRDRRRSLLATLPWALAGYAVAVAPLALHFALHPQDLFARIAVFRVAQGASPSGQWNWLGDSLRLVVGVFLGLTGDPASRQNIPFRPPFAPWLAGFFALGLLWALWRLRRRDQVAVTLLAWWGLLCVPAVLAAETNPHSLRLLAALPPALLLAAWPVAELADRLRHARDLRRPFLDSGPAPGQARPAQNPKVGTVLVAGLAILVAALGLGEAVRTASAYFVTWASRPELQDAFQVDLWTLGQRLSQTDHQAGPPATVVLPLSSDSTASLAFGFRQIPMENAPIGQIDAEAWLNDRLGRGSAGRRVILPLWRELPNSDADARGVLPFYLGREGSLVAHDTLPAMDLQTYVLDARPHFAAPGQEVVIERRFSPKLTLISAHLGAAFPNADRSGLTAQAGSSLWAVLDWRVQGPVASLRAAVDLADPQGHRLASADQWLWPEQAPFPGDDRTAMTVSTYHLVPVPDTEPIGQATLGVRVYDAGSLQPVIPFGASGHNGIPLAPVTVTRPAGPGMPPRVDRPMPVPFAAGFSLVGMDNLPQASAPGETLTLRLYWRIDRPLSADQPIVVSLDPALAGSPAGPTGGAGSGKQPAIFGTSSAVTVTIPRAIPAAQFVHTYVDVRLQPELAPGAHELWLSLPDGSLARQLALVNVAGRPRQFSLPSNMRPLAGTFGQMAPSGQATVALAGVSIVETGTANLIVPAAPPGGLAPNGNDTADRVVVHPGQSLSFDLAWRVDAPPGEDSGTVRASARRRWPPARTAGRSALSRYMPGALLGKRGILEGSGGAYAPARHSTRALPAGSRLVRRGYLAAIACY